MANEPTSQAVYDTDIPFLEHGVLRRFLSGEMPLDPHQETMFLQRASAEINRRFSRKQIELLEAQGRQLEAQGRQNEAQLRVANSVKWATWGLSAATVVLVIVTAGLWNATNHSV